jgi:crossover junction endodeoxyribonuclease RuvC
MRVLGIDPGTARLGYSIVDYDSLLQSSSLIACGIIQTSKNHSDASRLSEIRKDLIQLIKKFNPDISSVEELFFFKNPKTLIPVAQARGVILEVMASHSIPVREFTPLQVKQILTGHGRAEKSLVAEMVKIEFKLLEDIKPDDAIDAIAIAVSLIRTQAVNTGLKLKSLVSSS